MIFDTNTYSAFVRKNSQVVELTKLNQRIGMPFAVLAELRAGFLGGNRSDENERNLVRFLALPYVETYESVNDYIPRYAELQELARRRGKALPNNDVWIAAVTTCSDDMLLTFDHDFEVFQNVLGGKLKILN